MAIFELVWVFSTYTSVFALHTFKRAVPVFKHNFVASRHLTLLLHLSLPVAEIIRYHIRALWGEPHPTPFDFLLCLLHSFTALKLAARLKIGDKIVARPNYQTLAVMRVALSLYGLMYGNAFFYAASIRIINGFIYPRIFVKVASQLKVLPTYTAVYSASNFVASMMSVHETRLFLAPHAFVTVFFLNVMLNRWVSTTLSHWRGQGQPPLLAFTLMSLGFVETASLQMGFIAPDNDEK